MSQATALQHFSDTDFETEVLESDRPVLVDFYADWCGPCRALGPAIEELASELGESSVIGKVNVDENPQATKAYGVSSIPTVLLFHKGQLVERFVGVQPKQKYRDAIDALTGDA